jgi:hypothetical protein
MKYEIETLTPRQLISMVYLTINEMENIETLDQAFHKCMVNIQNLGLSLQLYLRTTDQNFIGKIYYSKNSFYEQTGNDYREVVCKLFLNFKYGTHFEV